MKINRFLKQFNWRFLLVRILVNALALAFTAAVTPKIYFVDKSVWSWLLMTLMLGVFNALLKPVLQFLTLQFIFVTYGLVIVLVNALILWLLSFLFPARFAVDNLLWALVGGLVLGLFSSFLESLLGLTMPIVPEEAVALRSELEEEARPINWRATATREAVSREQAAPALEPPVPEAKAAAPVVVETAMPEPSTEGSPTVAEAEPLDPGVALPGEAAAPPGTGVAADPEPVPEAGAAEKEDGS